MSSLLFFQINKQSMDKVALCYAYEYFKLQEKKGVVEMILECVPGILRIHYGEYCFIGPFCTRNFFGTGLLLKGIIPLISARTFTVFGIWTCRVKSLYKGAWIVVFLGTLHGIQDHENVKFHVQKLFNDTAFLQHSNLDDKTINLYLTSCDLSLYLTSLSADLDTQLDGEQINYKNAL